MRSSLFLCFLLLFSASLFAQSYTRTWAVCDTPKAVFDGSDKLASAIDGAENLYTAGYIRKANANVPGLVYIRKYSKSGAFVWEARETVKASPRDSVNETFALAVYKNGESLICYNDYRDPDMNIVISKFDASGKKVWQNGFNGPGNIDDEQPQKLVLDTGGNIILLLAESYDRNRYNTSYVIRYKADGVLDWSRELKGTKLNDSTYTNYIATDVTVDTAGSVYVTGNRQRVGSNYNDIYTYKLFAWGADAWSQVFSRDNGTDSRGYTIRYAKQDNTVVMCGTTRKSKDSILVVKYKALSGGKEVWNSRFPTQDYSFIGHSLVDAGNNIFVTSAFAVQPAVEPYVSKVSSSGALVWSKVAFAPIPNGQYDPCRSLDAKTDSVSNYYVTFNKKDKVLLQKYDKLGNKLFEGTYTSGLDSTGNTQVLYGGLGVTTKQDIYLASSFYSSESLRTVTCRSKYRLQNTGLLTEETSVAKTAPATSSLPGGLLYPNPAHSVINLPLSAIPSGSSIRIYDATGRQVAQRQLSSGQTRIDVSALKPGLYTLHLLTGTQPSTYKFIKE